MSLEGIPGTHAADEELELYSLGRLDAPRSSTLEEHLLVCPRCQQALAETDGYVRVMRAALAREIREPHQRGHVLPWLKDRLRRPAAASMLALCVLFLLWMVLRAPNQPSQFVAVALSSARGLERGAVSKAGAGLDMTADLTGLPAYPSYAVRIAGSTGTIVWETVSEPAGSLLRVRAERRFSAGRYWVRVYAPGPQGTLLREYALRVE